MNHADDISGGTGLKAHLNKLLGIGMPGEKKIHLASPDSTIRPSFITAIS